MQHLVQRYRAIIALAVLSFTTPLGASAQGAPARPDSAFTRVIRGDAPTNHAANGNGAARHPRSIRARLHASDGRVLVARAAEHHSFTWLAHDSAAASDSTWFEISIPAAPTDPVTIRDWKGRCLGHSQPHAKQPLDFSSCDRHSLFAFPAVAEEGFWLLSAMGYVGPTGVSSMLVPHSAGNLWFRIERDPAGRPAHGR